MSEMIERVARAMATYEDAIWDAPSCLETPSGNDPEDMREGYRGMARAAIAAMREPTEAMVGDFPYANGNRATWQAMIDIALNDGEM